jgi:hypothetical protein
MIAKIFVAVCLIALTGCTTVKSWVPSFSDPNQSARIIDVRQSVSQLDCSQPHLAQAIDIQRNLEWFHLYSDSKGWRQADVLKIIEPMEETVSDFVKRSQTHQGSRIYCETKKKIMQEQAATAARAILGRF